MSETIKSIESPNSDTKCFEHHLKTVPERYDEFEEVLKDRRELWEKQEKAIKCVDRNKGDKCSNVKLPPQPESLDCERSPFNVECKEALEKGVLISTPKTHDAEHTPLASESANPVDVKSAGHH